MLYRPAGRARDPSQWLFRGSLPARIFCEPGHRRPVAMTPEDGPAPRELPCPRGSSIRYASCVRLYALDRGREPRGIRPQSGLESAMSSARGYDGRDLAEDAVGLLDALEVDRAHIVGISMGGGIAQQLALVHSD